ncbi:Ada metal-binding domain-containing protein [uncultured Sporomusa sp.]|uniref:Ada metal-binding domain-containing protein n=1 Tax=uncultured Sporomusa sp. TaxID=307249 RepID=UPI002590F605|nr:Ada metal-binding domain-containing protein [uncultured Sporomusa sp.]
MRLKRLPTLLLTALLLITVAAAALASSYIGNSNTGKFHYSDCRWVSKMYDSHKVYFDSRQEAVSAGYVPCKVCKP